MSDFSRKLKPPSGCTVIPDISCTYSYRGRSPRHMEDAHLTGSSPWLASTKTSLFRNPRGSLLREQELKVKMFDRFLRQKESTEMVRSRSGTARAAPKYTSQKAPIPSRFLRAAGMGAFGRPMARQALEASAQSYGWCVLWRRRFPKRPSWRISLRPLRPQSHRSR